MIKNKKYLNSQVSTYKNDVKIRHHQFKTIKLIEKKINNFSGNFLDIGCANGILTNYLSKKYQKIDFLGVDIAGDLIKIAKSNVKNNNSTFVTKDIDKTRFQKKFDLVNASGMLSNYEEFEKPLMNWVKLLKPKGILVIFGVFNSSNIDVQVKIRNNFIGTSWQNGLTTYSIETVSKFLLSKKIKFRFHKFYLPIELKKQKDPIKTYTEVTREGKKIILTGANIVNEFFHLLIFND